MTFLFGRYRAVWPFFAAIALVAIALLTGCGGGGGGGGSSSSSSGPSTVTITGTLQDTSTGLVLPNRTVTVTGTSLSGTSNTSGVFSIGSVPITTITLTVVDSNGSSDGVSSSINLASLSGNPRSVGTITLNVSGSGPPPPPH